MLGINEKVLCISKSLSKSNKKINADKRLATYKAIFLGDAFFIKVLFSLKGRIDVIGG
jgi:hypothetical protein